MKTINKLTIVALAATFLFQIPITRADGAGRDHRNATITWTKWITAFYPDGPAGIFATIAGIGGGDIGEGTLIGEALTAEFLPDGITVLIEADYHFKGSKHSFTVHFNAVQTNLPGDISGVVTGVVTEGWLKGNVVTGAFTGYQCDQGIAGVCFDGTFEIERGSKVKH